MDAAGNVLAAAYIDFDAEAPNATFRLLLTKSNDQRCFDHHNRAEDDDVAEKINGDGDFENAEAKRCL